MTGSGFFGSAASSGPQLQILGPYSVGYNDDPSPAADYVDLGLLPAGLLIIQSFVVVTEDWAAEDESSLRLQVSFGATTNTIFAYWGTADLTPGEEQVQALSDSADLHYEDWGSTFGHWRQPLHVLSADVHLYLYVSGLPNEIPPGTGSADVYLMAFDAGVL